MRLSDMFTLYYLNADNGAANGGAGDTPTTTGEPAPAQPNGANNGGQQQDDPNNPKWLPERLAKAEASKERKILEAVKAKDVAELEALVKLAREYEASKLSESERTTKQVADLTTERDDWKTKYEAEKSRADQIEKDRIVDRVETALKLAAKDAKAKNVNDVLILLKAGYADDVTKLVNDKGEVQDKAVETLIEKFRKDKPEQFSVPGPGSPSNRGGKVVDPGKASEHDRSVFRNKIRGMA